MKKHICDSLHSVSYILCSDDECPLYMELFVGFNAKGALVIGADFTDYEEPAYNCSTAVEVNVRDAYAMARRNRVRYSRLPQFIAECMEDWDELVNPSPRDVRACMKEVVDCLIEEGCRLRIKRTYGRGGYMCC